MIDLAFEEFMLLWGVYGLSTLIAIGFGYMWGWFSGRRRLSEQWKEKWKMRRAEKALHSKLEEKKNG